jgi:hypothetical protein
MFANVFVNSCLNGKAHYKRGKQGKWGRHFHGKKLPVVSSTNFASGNTASASQYNVKTQC